MGKPPGAASIPSLTMALLQRKAPRKYPKGF